MFERLPGAEIGGEGDRTDEFRGADRLLDPSGQGRSSRPVFRRHRVDPTPSREKPSFGVEARPDTGSSRLPEGLRGHPEHSGEPRGGITLDERGTGSLWWATKNEWLVYPSRGC